MAQRNSRKGSKNPNLRTGGGRRAKAQRSQARQVQAERSTEAGPALRMRPAGAAGFLFVLLIAWLAIAAFCLVGLSFERWNLVSYPDSLWMYVAFGALAVAPAVGRVARSERDADSWGAQALLVPTALFVMDAVVGPSCPTGGQCGAIGARGSLGLFWSIVLIAAFAIAAWGLARWQYRSSEAKRPQSGRVRYRIAGMAMLALLVFPGLVLAAATIGGDYTFRDTPKLVPEAKQQVREDCYGLANAPEFAVRAAPDGYNPDWTTFAVRRANEDRPGVTSGGDDAKDDPKDAKDAKSKAKADKDAKDTKSKAKTSPLPTDWADLGYVHPYEATVSFNATGDVVNVTCRRIGPGTGNAVADDLVQPEPDSNPLSPKTTGSQFLPRFFTQGVAGPTEEAKKKAADEKQAAAAKQAAEAKADATKAKTDAAKDDTAASDTETDAAK
ncbi:MAG: hypothetical protein JWL76_1004 [Thermoleophilia bacterium]|nr:hypothetical protein [Thermoleophilia bacterium]